MKRLLYGAFRVGRRRQLPGTKSGWGERIAMRAPKRYPGIHAGFGRTTEVQGPKGTKRALFLEPGAFNQLWHKMKYEWMAFKARSAATLEADVDKILVGFGSDYRMTFC
ncbi:MAG: hypothetical protein CAPSK01_003249 [Candidatus Accumulibacter vicinus]|uniref:Uncharacterized protein n=1 Tax=Candidatus Accumulibacter vicinus TaxID=2954382 RepID=A0A084XXY7_9PROT|nr:MAG: hypothetical protein CAPSK01_003249 [Candidatus Accumulibacter vicinus]